MAKTYKLSLLRRALILFCFGLRLIPVSAQTNLFMPGITLNTPLNPIHVLTDDYNNDSKQDLVVLSDEGTGVPANAYVFLGNGDGTFQPAKISPLGTVGSSVPGIPAEWVNNIVVPIMGSSSLHLLWTKGDGSFLPFTTYTVDDLPTAAAVTFEPFSTIPEFAVVAAGNTNNHGSLSILLGHDDGTFDPAKIIPLAAPAPTSVTFTGAFSTGDLFTDLAIGTSTGIAFLRGNGLGTFEPEVDYPLSSSVTSILAFNFTSGFESGGLAATHGNVVSVLISNGDGTFQTPRDYVVGNGARSVNFGDFNRDQNNDLVVANYDDNTFSVLLGNGDGTFQPALTFPVNGTGPYSIAVTDFNNDGADDLAVSTRSGATPGSLGSAFVFLNTRGTSASITCSPNLIQPNGSALCTTMISPKLPALPVPTGNVALQISGGGFPDFCSGSLDATGKMQCRGNGPGVGVWGISLNYSGDKNYNPGTSSASPMPVITVDELHFSCANGTPDCPLSSTVVAGQTARFSTSLWDDVGYNGSVNLACIGAPAGAACSVPSSVKLGTPIIAAVSTTPRTMSSIPRDRRAPWPSSVGMAGIVLLSGVRARKQLLKQITRMLTLCVLVLLTSCGGNNSESVSTHNGTPAGSYTMTLTATVGGLKRSIPLILTVQ